MDQVLFAKQNENAVIPSKRDEDAGYDLYACFEEDEIIIEPHHTAVIPTGVIMAFPAQYVAILKERGSTGKIGLGQRGGVYDSGFRGEYTVSITNHNPQRIVITKGSEASKPMDNDIVYKYNKAIAQILFVPLAELEPRESTVEEVLNIKSERGTGRFGSSDK